MYNETSIGLTWCTVDIVRLRYRVMFGLTLKELQLFLIRLYLGLNFIPHFHEKLFAGSEARAAAVASFKELGVAAPGLLVLIAGVCEFASFVGLTFGVWTRLAGLGAALYVGIATLLGGHIANGFIWDSPGGGWEFPALWVFLLASFTIAGGGKLSVDAWLRNWSVLPGFLRTLSK